MARNKIRPRGPKQRKTLQFEFLGESKSVFVAALDRESGDQLGTFGEISLDKKSHATVPIRQISEPTYELLPETAPQLNQQPGH